MTRWLARSIAHGVFRGRKFHYRHLEAFARDVHDKTILEVGSGKAVDGKFIYSATHFFDSSNTIVRSDVVASYGHPVVDVTEMTFTEEFDVILCLNVLEHVFQFQAALDNLYRAAKPGGTVIVAVPGYYPLHDEPHDYWRFTEHALRRLMSPYRSVEIFNSGFRVYPFAYFLKAVK